MKCSPGVNKPVAHTSARPQDPPTSPVTKIHDTLFLKGCDQYLLVQTPTPTYICVPSYIFKGSDFYAIKSVPDGPPTDSVPGAERAIIIAEATVEEMTTFLWVFLNPLIDDYSKATLGEWFTILRLAHLWRFAYVKTMALRYIKLKIEQEIPGLVERIIRYEEYGTPFDTLVPLYVELCTREAPLSDAEWDRLESLPGKRLRRVVEVREKLKGSAGSQLSDAEIEKHVANTLGLTDGDTPASEASGPAASKPTGASSSTEGTKGTNGSGSHANGGSTRSGANKSDKAHLNAVTTAISNGAPGHRAWTHPSNDEL